MGRKLDQGILVQMVLQDTQVLAVHRITVGWVEGSSIGRGGDRRRPITSTNVPGIWRAAIAGSRPMVTARSK